MLECMFSVALCAPGYHPWAAVMRNAAKEEGVALTEGPPATPWTTTPVTTRNTCVAWSLERNSDEISSESVQNSMNYM